MCLIIVTRAPSKISRAIAESAARKNSDGVGVMWYDAAGKLRVKKWLDTPMKKWWKAFRQICVEAEAAGSELAVHWRMATHGDVCEAMTHPYAIQAKDGEVQMMHNGIISGYGEKSYSYGWNASTKKYGVEDSKSDTYEYARMLESILLDGGADLVRNAAFRSLLGSDIGNSNRLVFGLPENPDKEFFLVNRNAGVQHAGHWFSNTYAWDAHKLAGIGAKPYASSRSYSSTGTSVTTYPSSSPYPSKTGHRDSFWEGEAAGYDWRTGQMSMLDEDVPYTVEQLARVLEGNVSEAVDILSDISLPGTNLKQFLEVAHVDPREARYLLSKHSEEFAEEYLDEYPAG